MDSASRTVQGVDQATSEHHESQISETETKPNDPQSAEQEMDPGKGGRIQYIRYEPSKERQYLSAIRQLISKDLSEPYSIYVYRYFLYQWGDLCFMAMDTSSGNQSSDNNDDDEEDDKDSGDAVKGSLLGVVVSKLERHRGGNLRGYIAMLAVREEWRGKGMATKLVRMAIDAMIQKDADEIALETEITNNAAMKLYERLGFLRSKRLHRYYLNGNSAYRFMLYLKESAAYREDDGDEHNHAQANPQITSPSFS